MNKIMAAYDRSLSPLYVQVASVMRHRIEIGRWSKDEKIPTLDKLEQEFGVARVTIRQAIEILRKEGLLLAQQGRGTFVSGTPSQNRWFNLANNFEQHVRLVEDNVIKQIQIIEEIDSPKIEDNEGMVAAAYSFVRSVQYNNDQPFSVVNLFISKNIFLRNVEQFKRVAALPTILKMDDIKIVHAFQTLTIGVADPDTSSILNIGLGEPTANCRLVLVDSNNVAIYVAEIQYLRDCFAQRMDLLDKSNSHTS